MKTTYLVDGVVLHAAGGAKMRCSTFDHDKVPDQDVRLQRARKNGQMKTTYLVDGVVLRAAGGTKISLCAPQAAQKSRASPSTMTKYLTKMCDYKEHEKKWANEEVPSTTRAAAQHT